MTDPRAALAEVLNDAYVRRDSALPVGEGMANVLAERGVRLVAEERLRSLADDAGWLRLEDVLALSGEATEPEQRGAHPQSRRITGSQGREARR